MSYLSIDIGCMNCGHQWDGLVERPAPDVGEPVITNCCSECGHSETLRLPSAVTNLRASHPDGYSKGPGYQAVKEAARLRMARANMPNTDAARADINKEIRNVEKAAGRGYVKKEKGQK